MDKHQFSARRRIWGGTMRGLMVLCAAVTCALAVFLIVYVLVKGVPNLSWQLLSTKPSYLDGSIGILPDIITTVCTVLTTLLVVLPLGVCAAVYLTEYAANKRVVAVIEYAAETLSGIPSIIYGLVGQMFFCQFLGMKKSLLAGAMTLVIMNLPTIMRTTQESLKTVPQSYREGAFGLGAGKWRTIRTVVLPGCVDRLLSGRGPYPGRDGGPAVHRGLCPHAVQQPACHAGGLRCHTVRGPVCLCQGAGRVRRGLRHRRHPHGAGPAHQPGGYADRALLQETEEPMSDIITVNDLNLWYGPTQALHHVTISVPEHSITALIGPSGCGKSTFLKTLDRMNDLIPGVKVEGQVLYKGQDIYAPGVDVSQLRREVGMVFQKPNPFPMSIYDNVAYGPRTHGIRNKAKLDELVEQSLRRAAIWDEVKDRLKKNALGLSGGQQQRLCIARALAVEPTVLLMDEPTSALDPISTSRIEELAVELKQHYTIVIVTHNMQQALRISDRTAFFLLGELVEYGDTETMFSTPSEKRTEDYITGRFG